MTNKAHVLRPELDDLFRGGVPRLGPALQLQLLDLQLRLLADEDVDGLAQRLLLRPEQAEAGLLPVVPLVQVRGGHVALGGGGGLHRAAVVARSRSKMATAKEYSNDAEAGNYAQNT